MEICRFFASGRCAFGSACRLAHAAPGGAAGSGPDAGRRPAAAPPRQQDVPPPEPWYQQQAYSEDPYGGDGGQGFDEEIADTRETDMKEIRKLQKAMREIDALEARLSAGESLQANQLKKIEKRAEHESKISELEESVREQEELFDAAEAPPPGLGFGVQASRSLGSESPYLPDGSDAPPSLFPSASSHSPTGPPIPLCRHFLAGRCSFGDACRNSHARDRSSPGGAMRNRPELPFDPKDPECGICFESIRKKGERFGILESCDHAFCLKCIRSWRKQREQQDRQNLRLCPVCRNESFFVVPSDEPLVDSDEKLRVIGEYQAEMGRIPCKLFDYGRGKCAFGSSCFYAHLNPDGTRFVPAPLRWRNGADGSEVIGEVKLSDFLIHSLALT